jgi:plastocyanin
MVIAHPKDTDQTTHIVEIKDFSFVPKILNLTKGDKVVWINKDSIVHNIVNSSSQETLSATLAKGQEFSYIVKQGLNYECGFHPSMTGVVHLTQQ